MALNSAHAQKEIPATKVTFKKIQLLKEYHSEGASIGDINADGKPDIIAGSIYWLGPDFKKKYAYQPVKYKPLTGKGLTAYADVFFTFPDELTGDKWNDILQLSHQRRPAKVFINPGKSPSLADEHAITCEHCTAQTNVCNESPNYTNIIGDEQKELLAYVNNTITIAYPTKNPKEKWKVLTLTNPDKKKYAKGHGLGTGDINGDGLTDVIDRFGWWQQPKDWDQTSKWTFHPVKFAPLAPFQGGAQMFAYDVDNDGDNDVVTSLNAHAYGLAWFENKKQGDHITFTPHMIMGKKPSENTYGICFSQLHAMDCADIDGDGTKDIITGKCYYAHNGRDPGAEDPAVLYWFRTVKNADGTIDHIPYLIDSDSGVGRQISTGDLNNDGKLDIVTANKKGVFAFIQE